jgi:dienelactone hydrolase
MPEAITSAMQSQLLDYQDGDTVFEAYLAVPSAAGGPRPCVLLAHEWSGLNEGMRRAADRVAGLGHVCFALDVYGKGVRGEQTGDNTHLMAPLMADRALLRRRLLAGVRAASGLACVDETRLAAMGYCFGGLCALDLARAAPPGLLAAVSFHGGLGSPKLGDQAPIGASVLLLHGWEDPVAPPDDVLAVAQELTEAGADWQLHAYGHARHAFTFEGAYIPERGIAYDARADRRSWAAMRQFLVETLGTSER